MAKPVKTLLVLLATLAAAVSFRNDFMYFLLGFELMVLLAAWLQCLYISRHVSIKAIVPESIAVKGKMFKLCAELENNGVFPIGQLTARLSVQWFPEREKMLLSGRLMLGSRESGELCFELDPEHCGCADIQADMLEVSDSLGIMKRRCSIEDRLSRPLYILPDVSDGAFVLPESEAELINESGSSSRSGKSEPDINEIRPYRAGDAIKLVHWKLYARLHELLVREMSEPVERLICLYLDLSEGGNKKIRDDPDAWDNFIETVAAVSAALIRSERPHEVIWADSEKSEYSRYRVTDGSSMSIMLCSLLRSRTYQERNQSQILREIRKDETKGTCTEINLQGNITRSEAAG